MELPMKCGVMCEINQASRRKNQWTLKLAISSSMASCQQDVHKKGLIFCNGSCLIRFFTSLLPGLPTCFIDSSRRLS